MNLILDENTTKKQITLMYPNLPQEASIVIYTLPEKKARFYKQHEIGNMVKDLNDTVKEQNIFFNVLPQDMEEAIALWREKNKESTKKYYGRGFKETTLCIPGLWLDIDYKDSNHAKENLPTKEEAIRFVKSLPIKPTYIVESGHGFHVYYLFKEMWMFRDNIDRDKAEKLSKGFQEYVRQLGKENGWNLDQTGDLMRMLRLAGTYNLKDPSNPIPVTIYEEYPEDRYTVEDFESFVKPKEITQNLSKKTDEQDFKSANIELIMAKCKFMKYCHDSARILPEQPWYASFSILVFCENGEVLCHEWSLPYPNYREEETQLKLEHARDSAGPRTCENICEITNGEFCNSCSYYGKITSPIVLGYKQTIMNLDQALEIVNKAIEALKNGDVGAHLEKEAVKALAFISRNNYAEFSRLKDKIKSLGGSIKDLNSLIKTENKRVEVERYKSNENKYMKIDIGQDGKHIEVNIPSNYIIKDSGVYKVEYYDDNVRETQITYSPVIINKKFRDVEENKEIVSIMWKKSGHWFKEIIDREIICDSRKILILSSKGFPVNSGNSSEIVQYICEYEAANEGLLNTSLISNHLGWQGNKGNKGFLLYNSYVNSSGKNMNINEDELTDRNCTNVDKIIFHGETPGDEQIAKGFMKNGTYEEWKKEIDVIKSYPRVLMAFYSSFSTVLLEPLGVSNFIVELANRTSTGKTTALRVCASVWGNPDEKQANCIINSWDATRVWIERASSILYCLPLILDDTKRAKNPSSVAETIYAVANGRGRGRANVKSLAITKSWRTVLISTGETPAVYFTKDAGTRARVLEVLGKPFGETTDETREIVNRLNIKLKENFGFAGPKFVQYVLEHKDEWTVWKSKFREKEREYAERFSGEVSGRISEYLAIINITSKLANWALGLEWDVEAIMESLWNSIVDEAKDATGERSALEYVMSWAYSHEQTFEGREELHGRQPFGGWSGKWDEGDFWEYIAFYPNVLKKVLEEEGFDSEAILRGWKELGYLDIKDKSLRKYTKQIRQSSGVKWVIPIKRSAIENLHSDEKLTEAKTTDLILF
ncbi:DUF927 domain-containing protein [Clostridium sp.]|uniref:DUF927 domain-containing protein n=1 Tax=Clostridium sp. TaxID=1506 RepID=UPI002842C024|nr:DUF927 domain-containing protein [Clostridium sp.]MDR3595055.1 DUF927 domain-containing protein [Clostridium sp.]